MNMIRKAVVSGILLITATGGAYWGSPAFRAVFSGQVHNYIGWTEEARLADPVGFVDHVEEKLQQDIGKFQEIRRDLAGEVGKLVKKERGQRALLADAEAFAEDFRDVYSAGVFPVEVRNAAYTEEQLRSQLGITLAEIDGYQENIQHLEKVREEAEEKIEELVVQIDKTDAQLASLSTQRELLKVRELTASGSDLLAQVDDLFNQNQIVISSNPVRSVVELQASGNHPKRNASRTRVTAFLSQQQTGKVSITVAKPPVSTRVETFEEDTPIFQQSAIGKK